MKEDALAGNTADATFLVPLPPHLPDPIANLLEPYMGHGCVAIGPGWAMFDNAAQADEFAERLGTAKPTRAPVAKVLAPTS